MKNKGLKLLLLAGALLLTGCGNNETSSLNSSASSSNQPTSSLSSSEEESYTNLITIAKALELAKQAGDAGTSESYTVKGTVKEIKSYQYGDMTITDGTNELFIYGPRGADGYTYFDKLEDTPSVGDEVVLYGKLKDYNGTLEMDHPSILNITHVEVEFDESSYETKTIKEARNSKEGDNVKVTGVVSYITQANGYVNDGFYLVDNSEAIYIYGSNVASKVKVGNTVTVCGTKDFYVADSEASSASKYGYNGCNQISSATITANDNKTTGVWDKSWVKESTVKEIMDTPCSENITTTIFKVTAIVNKVLPASNDFVNYYINDLDGTTGSYVYTKNNGGDFSYLDAYDGKICTVYVSPINAKSSSSGCFWRFMPIAVEEDTSFSFDMAKATEFAYDYYVNGKIESSYTTASDAQVELEKQSTNEILGFTATYTYTSSNTDVISFESTTDNVIMHTNSLGEATVTISVAVEGQTTLEKTIEVEVKEPVDYETVTISSVIASINGTEVIVKGIVVSSLVNQTGFYLQDETGIIAVTGSSSDVAQLTPGDEVIVKGTRGEKHKSNATDCTKAGQINIYNSEILENYHGNYTYSSTDFKTDKTIEEIYNLDVTDGTNYTTTVYVVTGIITFETTGSGSYSTVVAKLYNETKTKAISLYCSSANQYKLFESIEGQVATVEVAITNWNCKSYYTGCVISATVGTTKIINTLNFTE